jgi:excisionase family DNA binding protein
MTQSSAVAAALATFAKLVADEIRPTITAEINAAVAAIEARASAPKRPDIGDNGDPLLLSYKEAAEQLGISRATIWRWAKAGRLRTVRVGHVSRITAASVHVVATAGAP